MTFWIWLRNQQHRDDPVGDLARDAVADPSWPRRAARLDTLDRYLASCRACDGAHRALRLALDEFAATTPTDGERA